MNILILGAGWIGQQVALNYLAKGYQVYVSCTSKQKKESLEALGLKAYVLNFDERSQPQEQGLVHSFDYVLNSIPSSSRFSVSEIRVRFNHIRAFLQSITFKKQIYLSSVGIYPDQDMRFDEQSCCPMNERLALAEEFALTGRTHIYRLAGLFGRDRIFAKYFQNRVCTTGDQLANFVHMDDVVTLIEKGFEQDLRHTVYNIVAPEHPTKKQVVIASAEKYNFALPSAFMPENSFQKYVDSSRIIAELNYSFKFPSPLDF